MKKGQMSLEMVVGLVILIVVAVVTIRMFINKVGSVDRPKEDINQIIRDMGFESECERLCNEYKLEGTDAALAKYCYTNMTGYSDLNRNGLVDSLKANTKVLDICEDMIYCFHVIDCESDTGVVDYWDECRQTVCDEYLDLYNDDLDKADGKVNELFPGVGGCDIAEDENWWNMYFGDMPCIFAPGVLGLRNCVYDADIEELSCETNCKHERESEVIVSVSDPNNFDFSCTAQINKDETTGFYRQTFTGEEEKNGAITISENLYKISIKVDECLSEFDSDNKGNWVVLLTCTNFDEDTVFVEKVS